MRARLMNNYLILKLQGAMQAWGTHTYEDYRPANIFPTRSGIVGLLGACLGIDRTDVLSRQELSTGLVMAVRSDELPGVRAQIITDYHTVLEARKVNGQARKDAILSNREYICDVTYTLALAVKGSSICLEDLILAVKMPHYTPFLGRKSCPLARPLFETEVLADSLLSALAMIEPGQGTIYSEEPAPEASVLEIRDVPLPKQVREFTKRKVYVLGQGGANVSQ